MRKRPEMRSSHSRLGRLPIRSLQALGAEVFGRYCWLLGVGHPDLDEMLDYYWGILSTEDLVAWSESSPCLVAVGLGDPLESYWVDLLGNRTVEVTEFHQLLGSLAEISVLNLYGAVQKEESLRFLESITVVARGHGVRLPDTNIFPSSNDCDGWGRPISKQAAEKIRASCLRNRKS